MFTNLAIERGPHIVVELTNIDQLVHQSIGAIGRKSLVMDIHCWKVVAAVATDPNIEAAPLWSRVDQSHGRKSFQVS